MFDQKVIFSKEKYKHICQRTNRFEQIIQRSRLFLFWFYFGEDTLFIMGKNGLMVERYRI